MTIDRMDWHIETVLDHGFPEENAATHIGMYLTWIIDNDMLGGIHTENEDSIEYIKKVKNREITGRDFLIDMCDTKFWDDDLTNDALDFTKDYYADSESEFSKKYGYYFTDYVLNFDDNGKNSIYDVDNTWENYNQIKEIIDMRYDEWKKYKSNSDSCFKKFVSKF